VRGYALLGGLALGSGIVLALSTVSPSWSGPPSSVEAALARIDTFPARARHHDELAALLRTDAAAGLRRREIEIAHWLAPRDPRFADALAATLAEAGDHAGALREIERSVEAAPRQADHPYLTDRLLVWLSAEEARAIERGLERAIAHDDPVAPRTLAAVHRGRGHPRAAAAVLERAADRVTASAERYALLLAAGMDRVQAEDAEGAARALRAAMRLRPGATAPYVWMLAALATTEDALARAHGIVEEGLNRGADAAELWFTLSQVAKRAGRPREQHAALARALAHRPALAKAHFELGVLMLAEGHASRAVLSLRQATERAPASVAYWYHLARAARASNDLGGARRALARALELAPDHADSHALLAAIVPPRP
jgi:tetratricopeptide (TPR) repeat protein